MGSSFRNIVKFLPLFFSAICAIYLILALVPGRLEDWHEKSLIWTMFLYCLVASVVFLVVTVAIFEIYNILRFLANRQKYSRYRLQISALISLLILVSTVILLKFEIPAKIYFQTSRNQFQQVLEQQILNPNLSSNNVEKYKEIKKIGNFKIADIIVDDIENNTVNSKTHKSVYFVTRIYSLLDTDRYGFAYLPEPNKTFASTITHLHGQWYIFFHRSG